MERELDCNDHTTCPEGYVSWHNWADKMNWKGYKQIKCPECGLYAIWVNRKTKKLYNGNL